MFCRQDDQNDRYFLPEIELYIYIQFHVRPFLKELLTPNHRYLIFINAEIEFVKIIDPTDTMSIFSSVRNARWLTLDQQNDEYLWDVVDQLLVMFLKKYFDDIENVLRRRGSGWSYNKLLQINVTHLRRDPLGVLGFGDPIKTPFNPHLYSRLRCNVLDVNRFLPHVYRADIATQAEGLTLSCVPATIALKFEYIKASGTLRRISIKTIKQTMKDINFETLLTPTQQAIVRGDFSRLEKDNLGFNERLKESYPFLKAFKGFSLNLFKIIHYPKFKTYRLVPIQLSQHWNSNEFLQIDLLDSNFAFIQGAANKHILLITHFNRLAQSCLLKAQGVRFKEFSCRACLKSHTNIVSHKAHCDNCHEHVRQEKSVLRRVRTNFIVHRPVFHRKDNRTVQVQHLKFENKNFFHTLQPLIYGAIDFEASCKVTCDPEAFPQAPPNNAVLTQKPLGVSLAFISPYEATLPPELERVNVLFFDERQSSLDEFYISLLTTLRHCLYFSYKFLKDTLSRDAGPPDLLNVPYADRLAYLLASHCSFCGLKYNSWTQGGGATGTRFVVRKSRHHNHFVQVPNLAKKGNNLGQVLTLCQTCNVATFSDGFISRTDLRIYSQNGSRYDHLFLADMLSRVGTRTFSQYDQRGLLVKLPILKGQPHLIYKSNNTILSLRIQFNCPNLATCQYHGVDKAKGHKPKGHCPYHRKILFMDSCLQITSSLDQMIDDLRKCRLNANLPSKMIYPKTFQLVCGQFKYSEEVFELIVKGKCPQPFEKIDSVAYALNMHEPPPREHFFSRLRGDHIGGEPSVGDDDYARFLEIFSALKCRNYLQLLIVYVATDTSLLLDCLNCYFGYLFGLSGLSPIYFLTNASFALEAALFNGRDPVDEHKPLKIELPTKKVHDLCGKALRGGFSFTNCNFNYYRGLELEADYGPVPLDRTKNMHYLDVNSLYPSILSQLHSMGKFVVMNDVRNVDEFHRVAQRLQQVDIDFFSAELHEQGHIYLFEVELDFGEMAHLSKVNCEVSLFPFYEKVAFEQLTGDQKIRGDRLARDPSKEPEKLLSYLKKGLKTTDYAENLLYLAGFHDIRIKKVKTIVRSQGHHIFRDWLFALQRERNKDFSPIMGRTMKNMANSIAGKYAYRHNHG